MFPQQGAVGPDIRDPLSIAFREEEECPTCATLRTRGATREARRGVRWRMLSVCGKRRGGCDAVDATRRPVGRKGASAPGWGSQKQGQGQAQGEREICLEKEGEGEGQVGLPGAGAQGEAGAHADEVRVQGDSQAEGVAADGVETGEGFNQE